MTTKQETEQANIFMWRWLRLIFVITLIGAALLIWYGETKRELWASWQTIADSSWDLEEAKPTLEIIP